MLWAAERSLVQSSLLPRPRAQEVAASHYHAHSPAPQRRFRVERAPPLRIPLTAACVGRESLVTVLTHSYVVSPIHSFVRSSFHPYRSLLFHSLIPCSFVPSFSSVSSLSIRAFFKKCLSFSAQMGCFVGRPHDVLGFLLLQGNTMA